VEDSLGGKPVWVDQAKAALASDEMKLAVVLTSPPWGTNQGVDAARDTALTKDEVTSFAKRCVDLESVKPVVSVRARVHCIVVGMSGWSGDRENYHTQQVIVMIIHLPILQIATYAKVFMAQGFVMV